VDFDLGGVDGSAVGVGDSEIGRAGADATVDYGDGFRIGGLGKGREGDGDSQENQKFEDDLIHVLGSLRVLQFGVDIGATGWGEKVKRPRAGRPRHITGPELRKRLMWLALGVPVTNVHCRCTKVTHIIFEHHPSSEEQRYFFHA